MGEKKKGFFSRLVEGLTKTRDSIVSGIDSVFSGFSAIDDDFYEEIEETLIMGDLGIQTTMAIVEDLRKKVKENHIKDPAECKDLLIASIKEQMDLGENAYEFENRKSVVLVIGVNGVGKTTSVGKLAGQLKDQGKKVILAAADTFRAAAIEQLTEWAGRAGVELIAQQEGSDPAAVIYDAIAAAKSRNADVLICDTAGRLHNKKNLMDELKKITRICSQQAEGCSIETLLVLDATTGQNAVNQAKLFSEVADITGIVLTKLDGTAKGGIIITIHRELGIPVKLVGVGEKIDDLMEFSAKDYADALFATETDFAGNYERLTDDENEAEEDTAEEAQPAEETSEEASSEEETQEEEEIPEITEEVLDEEPAPIDMPEEIMDESPVEAMPTEAAEEEIPMPDTEEQPAEPEKKSLKDGKFGFLFKEITFGKKKKDDEEK